MTDSWRPIVASSAILSLALLGDALIYAVLPVHADAFGVSLIWVGVLLSVNRFVRVFAYGFIATLAQRIGPRRLCAAALVGAIISTAMYGLAQGDIALLAARIIWGLAYAALVLVTLAYAVQARDQMGIRIGWSRAIQRAGPIFALVVGAWLTTALGPRMVFVWLAVLTAAAWFFVWQLPRDNRGTETTQTTRSLGKPTTIDGLFALQGFGVDGVFAVTVTLLLAQQYPIDTAIFIGGSLLAVRHLGEAVAAPLFGGLADRFGAARMFALSVALTSLGFAMVAAGYTIAGALVMLIFRGALAALGPALIAQSAAVSAPVLNHMARMQAWRDLGAAIGPFAAGFLLAVASAQLLHGVLAAAMAAGLWLWALVHRRTKNQRPTRG